MLIRFLPALFFLAMFSGLHAFAQQGPSTNPDNPTAAIPDQAQAKAAPSEEDQAASLQKAVQNPVASLISVPLQNNANFSYGPFNRTQDILNLEPVIPIKLTENWNLINRIIQPLVWQ